MQAGYSDGQLNRLAKYTPVLSLAWARYQPTETMLCLKQQLMSSGGSGPLRFASVQQPNADAQRSSGLIGSWLPSCNGSYPVVMLEPIRCLTRVRPTSRHNPTPSPTQTSSHHCHSRVVTRGKTTRAPLCCSCIRCRLRNKPGVSLWPKFAAAVHTAATFAQSLLHQHPAETLKAKVSATGSFHRKDGNPGKDGPSCYSRTSHAAKQGAAPIPSIKVETPSNSGHLDQRFEP